MSMKALGFEPKEEEIAHLLKDADKDGTECYANGNTFHCQPNSKNPIELLMRD